MLVGIGVGEFRNFELVGVGEKHRWSCDCVDLSLQDLLHCLQLAVVYRKV